MKKNEIVDSIPFLIGGLVVFNLLRNSQKSTALANAPNDPNTQLAIRMRQAFNSSGIGWLMGADGTDEDELFRLAPKLKGIFDVVSRQYQLLYNANLTTDLQDELSAATLSKFWAIVNGSNAPVPTIPTTTSPSKIPASKPNQVVATKAYNVRSDVSPYPVKYIAKVGQVIGKYGGEVTINLNGIKTAMYIATVTVFLPTAVVGVSIPHTTKYLIAKGGAMVTK